MSQGVVSDWHRLEKADKDSESLEYLSIHSLHLNPCVSFISSFPAAAPALTTVLLLEASASSYVVIQGDFLFLPSLRRSCHCGLPSPIHAFQREMFEFADLRIMKCSQHTLLNL